MNDDDRAILRTVVEILVVDCQRCVDRMMLHGGERPVGGCNHCRPLREYLVRTKATR